MNRAKIAQAYFSQGYVPVNDDAKKAILDLCDWVDQHRKEVATSTLADLISSIIAEKEPSQISVAITGGLDSRFLFAICQKMPNVAISAHTWGVPLSKDVVGAKWSLQGSSHHILDTRRVHWDAGAIVQYLSSIRTVIGNRLPRMDMTWLYRQLEQDMLGLRINGFIGGTFSGTNIGWERRYSNEAQALSAYNDTGIRTEYRPTDQYLDFIQENLPLLERAEKLTGFTKFEILAYAYRQRQRIEPAMKASGNGWLSPFADPRSIAWWSSISAEERAGQRLYKGIIASLYPKRNRLPFVMRGAYKVINKLDSRPEVMRNLADPHSNRSLQYLMSTSTLRIRDISGIDANLAFRRLMEKPTLPDWNLSVLGTSLDLHLRSMQE